MYAPVMSVWLVAEDRVQIVRAASIVSLSVVPVTPPDSKDPDPVARLPRNGTMRILAATSASRDAGPLWIPLHTFAGAGNAARILAELTAAISTAEQQLAGNPGVRYIHGPVPVTGGLVSGRDGQMWRIATELPVQAWPRSARSFKDQIR